ncbi:recombinase family protein [Acuticoccus sp. MNP-M23]|uniref:recombinase family protein n=1 Tax=Acuticoccus sp. MNP-M23 TaxID=3072793 RepID=UPI0028152FF2|nr:recombinase family protein [Acuticoccus sp. MNP-M23]WMS43118.1 recombinase family protein [Acuticoccus sp. MNP-M23]
MNVQLLQTNTQYAFAVIYCRVSSAKQTTRGDGLSSQETRCREFARYKGYQVKHVFKDDMSGSMIDRPGMREMLAFLDRNRAEPHVVIIDDISRLARGLDAHLQLRSAIGAAGGVLQSPSIEFGEDSDSILVENLLASVSQHQRQKNGEQTINRMRARTLNGYWVFQAPVGYRYARTAGHGNLLVRDEPCASILTEALEGFASGRFETQVEVKRFLEAQPDYPKDMPGGLIRNQRVYELLTRVVYAGYIDVRNWDVSLRPGKHEGLISFATFERIQARLKEGAKAPARKDINADFPLRGFILCDDCERPLTACWSKGKTKRYPYYLCSTKGCASYRKSIARADLEGDFEALLHALRPAENLVAVARAMFKDAWDARLAQASQATASIKAKLADLEKQIDQLLDRIVDTANTSVAKAYEQRIAKLQREQAVVAERLAETAKPRRTFEESFELALSFLSNPWKLWAPDSLALKRTVLRLAFSERIAYRRGEGLRTPKIAMPFKALEAFCGGDCKMAHPTGIEPASMLGHLRPQASTKIRGFRA